MFVMMFIVSLGVHLSDDKGIITVALSPLRLYNCLATTSD